MPHGLYVIPDRAVPSILARAGEEVKRAAMARLAAACHAAFGDARGTVAYVPDGEGATNEWWVGTEWPRGRVRWDGVGHPEATLYLPPRVAATHGTGIARRLEAAWRGPWARLPERRAGDPA